MALDRKTGVNAWRLAQACRSFSAEGRRREAARDKSRQCWPETSMLTSCCQRLQRLTLTLIHDKLPYSVTKIRRNDGENGARVSNGPGRGHRLDDRLSARPSGTGKPRLGAVFRASTSDMHWHEPSGRLAATIEHCGRSVSKRVTIQATAW
jgi:hypothetical protein